MRERCFNWTLWFYLSESCGSDIREADRRHEERYLQGGVPKLVGRADEYVCTHRRSADIAFSGDHIFYLRSAARKSQIHIDREISRPIGVYARDFFLHTFTSLRFMSSGSIYDERAHRYNTLIALPGG